MSWFGESFDWIGSAFDAGSSADSWDFGSIGGFNTAADSWDFGSIGNFGSSSSGSFFDSATSWLGNNAKTIAGVAKSTFGESGGSGTASRASSMSYKADYPAAQSQKAGDAGTPRGLRSVDPDVLARMWMSKMDTLGNKYK